MRLQLFNFKNQINETRIVYIAIYIILFIISLAVLTSYMLYQSTIKNNSKEFSTLTYIVSKNIEQTIKKNVSQLNNIVDFIKLKELHSSKEFIQFASSKNQFHWLVENSKSDPIIDVVTLINQDGKVLNFSRQFPPPMINLSNRDYFIYLSNHDDSTTFFSSPVENKGNGEWVFYLARRLNGPNHEFFGIALIGISIKTFSDLFEKIGEKLETGSSITLYSQNKTLLTRWPLIKETIGRINPSEIIDKSLQNNNKQNNSIIINNPSFNRNDAPIERMVNYQQVQDLPFIVGASITKDAYLTEWKKSVRLIFIITFIALIVIIWMFRMLLQSYSRNRFIQFQADHDPLTGLLNRGLFHDRFRQATLKSKRENKILAIIFVDVDRFKSVNDQFGHQIGDLSLQEIALRLQSCVRDYDSIARLGGDEFIILLENIESRENAQKVAETIRHKLHQKMLLNHISITLTVSIGISMYPSDGIDECLLIQEADQAMYEIKQLGGNAIRFFKNSSQERTSTD